MSFLSSDAGKRRLLTVEIPVIEEYNRQRESAFRIRVERLRSSLRLNYRLKPCHNLYELETILSESYPTMPPETRVVTPIKPCPHLFENQFICTWRQGSSWSTSRWDPAQFTCVFAIQAAWRWLACYEIWHETGQWPIPDAK